MKTPVLVISYKRKQGLKQVIESVKKYAPDRVYLFSDGPKNKQELALVSEVRDFLLNEIDWNCEIKTNFSQVNLGCKYGPQTAISWFFENEDQGIILEDDTVPVPSFYPFVEKLLSKYKSDLRVWNIGGTNRLEEETEEVSDSYFLSRFAYTWGWATWADRWKSHLSQLPSFLEDSDNLRRSNTTHQAIVDNWVNMATVSYKDELDAWDYLWSLRVFMNHGLSVVPKNNLINYEGYGPEATHTKSSTAVKHQYPARELKLPLRDPNNLVPNSYYDKKLFEEIFNWKPFYKKLKPAYLLRVVESRAKNMLN